jgi:hypothetical protein
LSRLEIPGRAGDRTQGESPVLETGQRAGSIPASPTSALSSQRHTRGLHRGSVVQREDTRFAPEECRFESDRNPPVHLETNFRCDPRAWIVHPAGLDTVSNTVGASPPGVRVPRYPPYQGCMGRTIWSGQLPGRQHRLEIGWHVNVFGSVPSHSANIFGLNIRGPNGM